MLKYFKSNTILKILQKCAKTTLLLFLLFETTACRLITLEELDISTNIKETKTYFEKESIDIVFSIEPERNAVESIINLKKNNSTVELDIFWNKKHCTIKPKEGFKKNCNYKFSICGRYRTFDDRYYNVDYQRFFIYGIEKDFFIMTQTKLPVSNKEPDNAIELTFNKSIDIPDFENNFSITPFIQIKKEYTDNDTKVIITPDDKWDINSFFTYSVKNIKSVDGYELVKEYKETFCAEKDYVRPELLSVNSQSISENINLGINDSLIFNFNKEIDFNSFKSHFVIQPPVRGNFCSDDKKICFTPEKHFNINQNYTVIIPQNIKDTNSIPPAKEYVFSFTPHNSFLKITDISFNNITDIQFSSITGNPFYTGDQIQDQITPVLISDCDTLFIQLNFSKQIDRKCLTNIEKAVSLNAQFPPYIKTPRLREIKWNDSQNSVILKYENFSYDAARKIIYSLNISCTEDLIKSTSGEYMENSLCVLFSAE